MKQQVAFITGIAGFAGSHLAKELLDNGYKVTGAILKGESTVNIATIGNKLRLVEMDILDRKECTRAFKKFQPDYVFHLAAFASVGMSFDNERLVYRINFDGTLNMLAAAVEAQQLKSFVFISSSDCYGTFSPKNKTLDENQPLNPISPYGISKTAAEFACQAYAKRFELPTLIARSFNHSGPRQSGDFVIPSFAKQIAAIERGQAKPVIHVGNLSAKRDLSDVRDIVRGYRLMAEKGQAPDVYQFSSGKAVSIESVLKQLLRLSKTKISVRTDKARLRPNDIPLLRGDNSKAVNRLDYRARYSLKDTLEATLNYWREKPKI